jgi:hypothetical protein
VTDFTILLVRGLIFSEMMEVEELPPTGDTEMFPEDASWYDDHNQIMAEDIMTDDVVEVDMDAPIEYEMEDHDENIVDLGSTYVPIQLATQQPLPAAPRSPPPQEVTAVSADIASEGPSHAQSLESSGNSPQIFPISNLDALPLTESSKVQPIPSLSSPHDLSQPEPSSAPASDSSAPLSKAVGLIGSTVSETGPVDSEDRRLAEAVFTNDASAPAEDAPLDESAGVEATIDPLDTTSSEVSPVLILNPTSTTLPSFYLFTSSGSISSSPSQPPPLYLKDQIQLFYEPLQSVFQVLHELADDLDIADHSEFVMCSEGLDLTIPEVRASR